ncbi:MAG TPA: septum site-determining protein MinD [Clostridiales bacterium]|nr:septum site-determining protein MinD [Clostridiales bacterium]
MSRKIVVTSGKGGVGKTTICANIGIKLAELGQKVVMLDLDIGLNNLDVVMGIENKVVYDISDVIEGKCRLKQALVQDVRCPYLYTLPSNKIFTTTKINSYNIKAIVDALGEIFDYVIIDCPAGIDSGFHRAVYSASEAIVVCTPHISSIRDADKVLTILNSYKLSSVGFVVNRARGDLILNGQMIDINQICNLLKSNIVGVIPDDDSISMNQSMSSHGTKGGNSFEVLAKNIHYCQNRIFDCKSQYKGIFGAFRRKMRQKYQ